MNTSEYVKRLMDSITSEEWDMLEREDPSLVIGAHNRETLLEMRAFFEAGGGNACRRVSNTSASAGKCEQLAISPACAEAGERTAGELANEGARGRAAGTYSCTDVDECALNVSANAEVDERAAEGLARELQSYLDEYMQDTPEGHKWIILASLYLAFVAKRPMHPIERAGVEIEHVGDEVVYRCPLKVAGDNFICDACVCEPLSLQKTGHTS